jgi:hypothetical protein
MLTLQHLTTPEGVQHLVDVTGGTKSFYNHPETAQQVQAVAQGAIDRNPNLAHVKVRILPNLPNAYYNYDQGELILGITNPHALAHELAHADNLRQSTLYKKVLRIAQGVTRLNQVAAVPTVLALRMFLQDKDQRNDILQTLSAISSAAAAPGMAEEVSASAQALRDNPNRLDALKTLGPAMLAHAASSMAPSLIYSLGRS